MTTPMFASIRKYSNAPKLADELVKHENEIRSVLKPLPGFHSYYMLKTGDGVVEMTVSEDRAGAEQSNRVTATWLKDKLPTFANRAPEITTGELRIHLSEKTEKVAVLAKR